MIKSLKVEQTPLTRELAEEFATMPASPCERRVKPQRLDFLRSKIDNGLFFSPKWATVKVKSTGRIYRINGQHSSLVLAEANGHFPRGLTATIEHFVVDTEDDIPLLFDQFDNPISSRTNQDLIKAYASTRSELSDFNLIVLSAALSGFAASICPERGGKSGKMSTITGIDRARLVHDAGFIRFALWAIPIMSPVAKAITSKSTCYMAMHRTYSIAAADSETFWTWVRDESHPDNKHPSRVLAKFLITETGRGAKASNGKGWTQRAISTKCVHAWNAFRRGESTALKYIPDTAFPKAV